MVGDVRKEGNISEWNEGNFKSARLHDAQTIINYSKMNLLTKSPSGEFNFELWISGIDAVYGEGHSKYKQKEIDEVEKIRTVIRALLEYKFPFSLMVEDTMSGKRQAFVLNKKNWDDLRQAGELFEKTVKKLNDIHGLSTRNVSGEGLL